MRLNPDGKFGKSMFVVNCAFCDNPSEKGFFVFEDNVMKIQCAKCRYPGDYNE